MSAVVHVRFIDNGTIFQSLWQSLIIYQFSNISYFHEERSVIKNISSLQISNLLKVKWNFLILAVEILCRKT